MVSTRYTVAIIVAAVRFWSLHGAWLHLLHDRLAQQNAGDIDFMSTEPVGNKRTEQQITPANQSPLANNCFPGFCICFC